MSARNAAERIGGYLSHLMLSQREVDDIKTIIESECGRWHPYPEETAPAGRSVWITVRSLYGGHAYVVPEAVTLHMGVWRTENGDIVHATVLAWEPLDEPYQKEEGK